MRADLPMSASVAIESEELGHIVSDISEDLNTQSL